MLEENAHTPLGGCFRGTDMLVFPPYLWHCGLGDCGEGRQLSHLVILHLVLTLSLAFVVACSDCPSHMANTNTQLPEGAGRCVGSEGEKEGAWSLSTLWHFLLSQ